MARSSNDAKFPCATHQSLAPTMTMAAQHAPKRTSRLLDYSANPRGITTKVAQTEEIIRIFETLQWMVVL
jgi:hypothetical protein